MNPLPQHSAPTATREYFEGLLSLSHLWPEDWCEEPLERSVEDARRLVLENERDGTLLLLVPEGEFLAGGQGRDEGHGQPFPVRLPDYYLALHPVTNAQYARFLVEVGPSEADLKQWILLDRDCGVRRGDEGCAPVPGAAAHPVMQVSWPGAQAYCDWAGLRLPSELEWEKGARGCQGLEYPWGPDWDPERCRNLSQVRVAGQQSTPGARVTCSVWSHPSGCSPWGHYQMAGNVLEWCADWYDHGAYARYRRRILAPPATGTRRVARGGAWRDKSPEHFRCAARRSERSGPPLINTPYDYGFRPARSC